jgi:hypothetical protein
VGNHSKHFLETVIFHLFYWLQLTSQIKARWFTTEASCSTAQAFSPDLMPCSWQSLGLGCPLWHHTMGGRAGFLGRVLCSVRASFSDSPHCHFLMVAAQSGFALTSQNLVPIPGARNSHSEVRNIAARSRTRSVFYLFPPTCSGQLKWTLALCFILRSHRIIKWSPDLYLVPFCCLASALCLCLRQVEPKECHTVLPSFQEQQYLAMERGFREQSCTTWATLFQLLVFQLSWEFNDFLMCDGLTAMSGLWGMEGITPKENWMK